MTKERLACSTCNGQGYYYRRPDDVKDPWTLQKCDHEIDRLHAENKRYREALERCLPTSARRISTCEYEFCVGDYENGGSHEPNCIIRIAYDALNPEPVE